MVSLASLALAWTRVGGLLRQWQGGQDSQPAGWPLPIFVTTTGLFPSKRLTRTISFSPSGNVKLGSEWVRFPSGLKMSVSIPWVWGDLLGWVVNDFGKPKQRVADDYLGALIEAGLSRRSG